MTTTQTLQGKVAFIQGGSRGIGAAIVKRLAHEGAAVAFTYVSSAERANALASAVTSAGGKALALKADSADAAAVQQAIRAPVEHSAGLHILVNNPRALHWGSTEELTLEQLDHTLAVNVRSVFVASQEAAKHMTDGGRIINIGSTNAERIPVAGGAIYAMSKSALVGLAKGMARDLGPRNITVNNVQPGPVDTEMNPADGEGAEFLKGLMALDRFGKAGEIAGFVAYLAGPEAGYITGASLMIDGGFSA